MALSDGKPIRRIDCMFQEAAPLPHPSSHHHEPIEHLLRLRDKRMGVRDRFLQVCRRCSCVQVVQVDRGFVRGQADGVGAGPAVAAS